jgi:large-conductance mechanosensitive channel
MTPAALSRIERLNYLLGGVLVAASALFLPTEQALGILVGAAIGSLNFSMIRRIVTTWISHTADGGNSASGFFLIPKMGALIAAVFLAMRFLPISPAFLAIGFSIFLLSIAIEMARYLTNPPDDPDAEEDVA